MNYKDLRLNYGISAFFVTSIGHMLVHSITLVYPAIMVILKDEFGVSLVELGQLGTIQFALFGLGALPAGWFVDHFGSRRVLLAYFFGLALSSVVLMFSNTFTSYAFGLGLLGLISGLYHPAGLKLISQTKNMSKNMGYHGVFGSIGLALGPLIGGGFGAYLQWKYAYLFLGSLAILSGIFSLVTIPNDQPRKISKSKFNMGIKSVHIIAFVVTSLYGFAHHGLLNFLPIYLSESIDWALHKHAIGGVLTSFVLFLGIIGQIVGGRLGSIYPRNKLLFFVVLLNIPLLIIMSFVHGSVLIGTVAILGAVNFTFQPVYNSLIADITPIQKRGMIYGIAFGLGFGVGSFSGIIGGYIGEYIRLQMIFPFLSIVLIPAVVLSLWIKKNN